MERLQNYIITRQKEMVQQNNKVLELTNLNFLKNQAKKIIDRIIREKSSEEEANRLIDKMAEQYKVQSVGQNRFQLLTLSLNILHPSIHKIIWERDTKGIKREGDQIKHQKLQLQQRVNQLKTEIDRLRTKERESSSKCCEIM